MKPIFKTTIHVIAFSIAMGFLEAAVVIYLRELYYPFGFTFPLKPMPVHIMITELLRELATIVMLLYIGILSGRTFNQRFAFFLISFAIWDIFYYVFLKAVINWPASIVEWDVLFLIPTVWVGPVLAPCIVSLTMILLGIVLLRTDKKLLVIDWLILVGISLLYIYSFTKDQFNAVSASGETLMELSRVYVPVTYHWTWFIIPLLLFIAWLTWFYKRVIKTSPDQDTIQLHTV